MHMFNKILISLLILLNSSIAIAQDLVPSIQVLPGSNVEVGEEVYLSATGSTYPDTTILQKARYEWDFGDGYSCKFHSGIPGTDPYYYLMCQGIALTHYFMTPGDYTVTLSITAWADYDADGTPLSIAATSSSSVSIGLGTKEFVIETGLPLQIGMSGLIRVTGNTSRYMKGTITSYNNATGDLAVNVTSKAGYETETFSTWSMSWDTLPLVIGNTTTTIHVTGEAPMAGFEIQRSPFHNRLAQYLYVQVPPSYTNNQTSLRVTLEGTKGTNTNLLSKSNLNAEERVFLDQRSLPEDDYVVTAELVDSNGQRIPGGIWRDKFSKSYSGIPKIGIDENNSFRVNGELFFPIAPYMTDNSKINQFIDQASINALNTEGYYPTHNIDTWTDYLNKSSTAGLMAIGPGRGDYAINFAPAPANRWKMNHNPDRMSQYVQATKNNTSMFAWIWQDEPNLGGYAEKTYLPTLAAWSYICHKNDPNHLAYNLYVGTEWSRLYGTSNRIYDYLGSAMFFGGKKWMQDVFSFDTYPITQRLQTIYNFSEIGPYAAYIEAFNIIKTNNKNLTPIIPALQPCAGLTTSVISEDQVYFETWMNVIHGAKGILWFPYFGMDTTGRWTAMKKFADQMKILAPAVLQANPTRTVVDDADIPLKRVDTIIREYENNIYVFAARVTEPDVIDGALYQGVEPESITASFSISGMVGDSFIGVVDESRVIPIQNGQFSDTFSKNAVHIYRWPAESHKNHGSPKSMMNRPPS